MNKCNVCWYLDGNAITTYAIENGMFFGSWHDGRDCIIPLEHSCEVDAKSLHGLSDKIVNFFGEGRTVYMTQIDGHAMIFVV